MKSGEIFLQGYNAQVAVDSHRQIIVAQSLTNSGSDMHQMIPLLKQIRRNLGRQAQEASADSGVLLGIESQGAGETSYSRLRLDEPSPETSKCRAMGTADE